jgi:hypothetical protein
VGESDTALIISDMLSDIFGYSKYEHITTEHAIRGTYVDLAVVVGDELRFLVEVKAIGVQLKDGHVKQAIDYGANKGAEWVVLTNGVVWRVYKVIFAQPIDKTLICDIDLLAIPHKSPEVLETFGNLCREGYSKGSMTDLVQQKQITSKFAIASVLTGEVMVTALRKELRRLSPGLRVDPERLKATLADHVIKRELIDSEEAHAAQTAMKKLARALEREKRTTSAPEPTASTASQSDDPTPADIA